MGDATPPTFSFILLCDVQSSRDRLEPRDSKGRVGNVQESGAV